MGTLENRTEYECLKLFKASGRRPRRGRPIFVARAAASGIRLLNVFIALERVLTYTTVYERATSNEDFRFRKLRHLYRSTFFCSAVADRSIDRSFYSDFTRPPNDEYSMTLILRNGVANRHFRKYFHGFIASLDSSRRSIAKIPSIYLAREILAKKTRSAVWSFFSEENVCLEINHGQRGRPVIMKRYREPAGNGSEAEEATREDKIRPNVCHSGFKPVTSATSQANVQRSLVFSRPYLAYRRIENVRTVISVYFQWLFASALSYYRKLPYSRLRRDFPPWFTDIVLNRYF